MCRLLVAALATLIVMEFSQTSFAQEGLTGHTWRKFPQNMKTVYIRGFLPGFLAGNAQGHLHGLVETYMWAEMLMCKSEKDIACINFRKLTVSEARKEIEETISKKYKYLESSNDYYVKEIDSFYEAFSLCRGQMLEITLAKLTSIWVGIADSWEDSYNKIGSACGEQK